MKQVGGILLLLCGFTLTVPVHASDVEIVKVTAENRGTLWHFSVTLRHADTGWDHYADGWRIVTADGKELGMRTLFHPHETEQPFTRSLEDVKIPAGTKEVFIEAHDKGRGAGHGWSKKRYRYSLVN